MIALFFWATWLGSAITTEETQIDRFTVSMQLLRNALFEDGSQRAASVVRSEIRKWRHSVNDLDALLSVVAISRCLSPSALSEERDLAASQLNPTSSESHLYAGLLSLAADDFKGAEQCFVTANQLTDPNGDSVIEALLARARFRDGLYPEAIQTYAHAVDLASASPIQRFRVRFQYALDCLEKGLIPAALRVLNESRDSGTALEKGWALEELQNHAVSENDWNSVKRIHLDIATLLPTVTSITESAFEGRRVNRQRQIVARTEAALKGNSGMRLLMVEEAMEYPFSVEDFRGVINHLTPLVQSKPLSTIGDLPAEVRDGVLSVHFLRFVAYQRLGYFMKAEKGFRSIIEAARSIPLNSYVLQTWGFLGDSLREQGRFDEAMEAYDISLIQDVSWAPEPSGRLDLSPNQFTVFQGIMPTKARESIAANRRFLVNLLESVPE